MRKPSPNIHQLIHSLTKEEKKRITIHLKGLGKKGETHLRLLKAIAKQEHYDEAVLKKTFRGLALSIAKKRLYDLMLDVLIQLNYSFDIHHELLSGLQRLRVLFQKDLYQQARDEAFRLVKLAEENDRYDYFHLICMVIIDLENTAYLFQEYDQVSLKRFFNKIRQYESYSFNEMEYILLKAEMYFFMRRKVLLKKDKIALAKMMRNPLLQSIDEAIINPSKLHFYQIHFIHAVLTNNGLKAYHYAFSALDFFEKNGYHIDSPEWYFRYLFNANNSAIYCRKEKVVNEIFEKMEQTILRIEKNQVYYQLQLIEVKANWYSTIGNIGEGKKLIEEYRRYLDECDQEATVIYFLFAFIVFLDKSYDQTLLFVEKLIDKELNKQYDDLRLIGKVFKLLIYFELSEFSLLESHIRSLYRKCQQDKDNYKLVLMIIGLFRKLLKSNTKEQKQVFKDFKKQLIAFKSEMTTNEATIIGSLSFTQWIDSHLENTSLLAYMHLNAHKKD